MKKIKFLFTVIIFSSFIFMYSCSEEQNTNNEKDSTEVNKIEDTDSVVNDKENTKTEGENLEQVSKYICPMHCDGSDSEEPGSCPKCGMDLIENPDLNK